MAKAKQEILGKIHQRPLNKEYKLRKENPLSLYDRVVTYAIEWPSVTVEWLPDREEPGGKNYSMQKLILGTYNSGNDPNYLMLAQVQLPLEESANDAREFGEFSCSSGKVQIIQLINHAGEVNRALYMPQNPFVVATKTVSSDVYLFDYRKHPSKPPLDGACNPELMLKGHIEEGFGLSWSILKQGHLLSGSHDSRICLWDINATPKNKSLNALQIYMDDDSVVEDVAWHLRSEYLFGSVSEDHQLLIWDTRTSTINKPIHSVVAHDDAVNCLAFNPFNEWIVATGSSDKTVKLFDLRMINSALYTLEFHKEAVLQVGWNPKKENILSSCGLGRRMLVWDLSRTNKEQTSADAENEPPELLFLHGAHTNRVYDFSWSPCEDWAIASVAAGNILHIWKMAEHIYHNEDDMVIDNPQKAS